MHELHVPQCPSVHKTQRFNFVERAWDRTWRVVSRCATARAGYGSFYATMTNLTHTLVRIVATLCGVGMLACGAEDDGDTTNDPSLATTNPSTTNTTAPDTDDPSETTDDPTTMTTDDPTAETTDDPTTMTMTTEPMDTGGECPMDSECLDSTMCDAGETCLGCICIGGAETGTSECGTNVSTMNVACDDCSHMNCCAEVQGCFGDETVMMNTPCLELNNCIAMSCTMATTIEELQTCVDAMCADFADQLQSWLAFNQCLATSCAAECAG